MSRRGVVWLALPWLGLLGCEAPPPTDPAGASRAAVVYGVDGRTEVYAHPSATLRAVAESAIAVKVNASVIDDADPTDVRFNYSRTLGEAQDLCAGERFADQIEPGTCSGTLIDDRYLLTAGHCMDSPRDCTDRVWVFGFRYVADGQLATLTSDDVYGCARVLAYFDDDRVDHAIVELDRPVVGRAPATVVVAPSGLPIGTPLALIGHPNGLPMKIDDGGEVVTTSADAASLEATLDAFNGNSGSGVFNASGELVALLRGGMDDYVSAGACNVVNVIDPAPTDDGEGLTYVRPALEALCATPGIDSPLCGCDGPCVPSPPGDRCDEAEAISPVDQVIASTLRGYSPTVEGECGGAGPDRAWTFELTEVTRLTARSEGFDTVLYLRERCGGADLACHDDVDRRTDRGSRIEERLGPGSYVLVLDSYDADVDDFTLTLTFAAERTDAGPPPTPDAGAPTIAPDAGGEPAPSGGGCVVDRSGADSPLAPWALLLGLGLVRRR